MSIKAARVEKGYTQDSIAQKLGVSVKTYNNWENGVIAPKQASVYAIAYVLGMNAEDLRLPTKKEKIL